MSEMMTTEILVEAEWILRGYWTKGRLPIKTSKGGWSDFDVVAYHPHSTHSEGKSHFVIAEAKAYGTKDNIFVTTQKNKEIPLENIKNLWVNSPKKTDPYFLFLLRLNDIDKDFIDFINQSVETVTIQLVSNWMLDQEKVKEEIEASLAEKVKELELFKGKTVNCSIETPLEVFKRIMKMVRGDNQGRRYGNPILDLAREFNRYLNPSYFPNKNFSRKEAFEKYTRELFGETFRFKNSSKK